MIRWLLDPCGRHGLGTRVLESVVSATAGGVPLGAVLSSARARCEVQAGTGRIDILVEAPGLCLVIENKVDANEGEDQCGYYYRHFCDRKGARFVFLTPSGAQTVSATGDASNVFLALSYVQLAKTLEKALSATASTPAASGRHIAEDYLRTLKQVFQ